jgi:hypothetical protein
MKVWIMAPKGRKWKGAVNEAMADDDDIYKT